MLATLKVPSQHGGILVPIVISLLLLIVVSVGWWHFGLNDRIKGIYFSAYSNTIYKDALDARLRSELTVFTNWLAANNVKGYIGEVSWPDNTSGDGSNWNAVADNWFKDADKANLWVTVWGVGEWWGTGYRLSPYFAQTNSSFIDSIDLPGTVLEKHPTTPNYLRGVNVSGGEFGAGETFSNSSPGKIEFDYHYDSQETFDYLASRGVKLVRIPFRWERLQPKLNAPLDNAELTRLQDVTTRAQTAGLQVILDMHNFGEYIVWQDNKSKRLTIGSTQLPISSFSDVWQRLSQEFKDNPTVYYDLMNEPYGLETPSLDITASRYWEQISQQVVETIRRNGDTKLILIPGYNYSGAQEWDKNHPKAWINDPANNIRYEAHHYFDNNHSGSYGSSYAQEVESSKNQGYSLTSPLPIPVPTAIPTLIPTSAPLVVPSPIELAPTASPTTGVGSTITVYAAGLTTDQTYPSLQLIINGHLVEQWTDVQGDYKNRVFQPLTYQHPVKVSHDQIQVKFINDLYNPQYGIDRNVLIDRINIDGIDYQSESPATYSIGSYSAANGCGDGFKQSEWLHCNGYFDYR